MSSAASPQQQSALEQYERTFPNMDYPVQPWPEGDFRRSMPPKIKFFVPNSHCAWRVDTLNTKEPDTIAWLATMKPGEVFFDVGANMGQYALIAHARGLIVHAFEPDSQNFALLCRNVSINHADNLTAWPLCLSDEYSLDVFYSQQMLAGNSCNSFGEAVNFHLQPKKYPHRQGSVAVTMSDFCIEREVSPTHVKIDVDGFEHKVVEGMGDILLTVKSVLVEINTALPEHLAIIDVMRQHGLEPDTATADTARRTEGAFAGIGNMIFYRKE